jgi:hypothetical protein
MAENPLVKHDRIRTEARDTEWSTLLARAIDDITRLAHSEVRLMTAGIRTALTEQTDRIFAFFATGALMAAGALCLIAAAIMFLHEFARLPWWQSFGITALALFAIGIAIARFAWRRPQAPAIT